MLKGSDPQIGPELPSVLAEMGHGDEIVIADANFPAQPVARHTAHGTALRIGCDAVQALKAVLSLMPIDEFAPEAVLTMQIVDDPGSLPAVVADALPILAEEGHVPRALERFAFHRRAESAFAVVRSTERRPYGNFILRKGVIGA